MNVECPCVTYLIQINDMEPVDIPCEQHTHEIEGENLQYCNNVSVIPKPANPNISPLDSFNDHVEFIYGPSGKSLDVQITLLR